METRQDLIWHFVNECPAAENNLYVRFRIPRLLSSNIGCLFSFISHIAGVGGEIFTDVRRCEVRLHSMYVDRMLEREVLCIDDTIISIREKANKASKRPGAKEPPCTCNVYHPVIRTPTLTVWILCAGKFTQSGVKTRHGRRDHWGFWVKEKTGKHAQRAANKECSTREYTSGKEQITDLWGLAAHFLSRISDLKFEQALKHLDVPIDIHVKPPSGAPPNFFLSPTASASKVKTLLSNSGLHPTIMPSFPVGPRSLSQVYNRHLVTSQGPSTPHQSSIPAPNTSSEYQSSSIYNQRAQAGPSTVTHDQYYEPENDVVTLGDRHRTPHVPDAGFFSSYLTQAPSTYYENQAPAMLQEDFGQLSYSAFNPYPAQSSFYPGRPTPVAPEPLYPTAGSTPWPSTTLTEQRDLGGSAYDFQGSYSRLNSPTESIYSHSATPLGTSEQYSYMSLEAQYGYDLAQPSFPSYPRDPSEYFSQAAPTNSIPTIASDLQCGCSDCNGYSFF